MFFINCSTKRSSEDALPDLHTHSHFLASLTQKYHTKHRTSLNIRHFVVVFPKILLCWYLYFGVRLNVCGCKKKSGQTLGDLFYHVLKHSYVGCSFIALPSKMLRAFVIHNFFHRSFTGFHKRWFGRWWINC